MTDIPQQPKEPKARPVKKAACLKLPNNAGKDTIKAAHKVKMFEKALQRGRFTQQRYSYANVGRSHPDYGTSPKEHAARKAARKASNKDPE